MWQIGRVKYGLAIAGYVVLQLLPHHNVKNYCLSQETNPNKICIFFLSRPTTKDIINKVRNFHINKLRNYFNLIEHTHNQ